MIRRAGHEQHGGAVLARPGRRSGDTDQLASRAGLTLDVLVPVLFELERDGWIERAQGAIWPC